MLTVTDALDLIDHLVETHGEDRSPMPLYVNAWGGPECIVAKVFHLAGVSTEALAELRNLRIDELRDDQLPIALTLGAKVVLRAAQQAQDIAYLHREEHAWGRAKRAAHKAAERFTDLIPSSLLPLVPQRELALV